MVPPAACRMMEQQPRCHRGSGAGAWFCAFNLPERFLGQILDSTARSITGGDLFPPARKSPQP
jgi:hypothetical protein